MERSHSLHHSFTAWACLLLLGHLHGMVKPLPCFLRIGIQKWPPYWKMGNLACQFTVQQQVGRMGVWSKGKEVGAKYWHHWTVLHLHPMLFFYAEKERNAPVLLGRCLHSPKMEVEIRGSHPSPRKGSSCQLRAPASFQTTASSSCRRQELIARSCSFSTMYTYA